MSEISSCNSNGGKLLFRSSSSNNKSLGRVAFRICQKYTIELVRKNSQRPQHVDTAKKATPQLFDWISNEPPSIGAVNVGFRWTASAWNLQPKEFVY